MADFKGETWKPKIIKFNSVKDYENAQFIDVRNKPEWKSTGVIENSICIPLPDLPKRVDEIKEQKKYVVSCRSGQRAKVAASILAQKGLDSVILEECKCLLM